MIEIYFTLLQEDIFYFFHKIILPVRYEKIGLSTINN